MQFKDLQGWGERGRFSGRACQVGSGPLFPGEISTDIAGDFQKVTPAPNARDGCPPRVTIQRLSALKATPRRPACPLRVRALVDGYSACRSQIRTVSSELPVTTQRLSAAWPRW